MSGKLTLVITPIDNDSKLQPETYELLSKLDPIQDILLIEDEKPARRRWVHWGLDRGWIEHFKKFNEHNHDEMLQDVLTHLKSNKNVYLMSDCGLPAFCDPGRDLVDLCHDHQITVTATPFGNSISLALALSGFDHDKFMFEGFIPVANPNRSDELKRILKSNHTTILMDTPYRLKKLLPELIELENALSVKREYFLAMDLNKPSEQLVRGSLAKLLKSCEQKKEFILIINKI